MANKNNYLILIFVLVFFFLVYLRQSYRFLGFVGSHATKTFFDGRPIGQATQKVDFSMHE